MARTRFVSHLQSRLRMMVHTVTASIQQQIQQVLQIQNNFHIVLYKAKPLHNQSFNLVAIPTTFTTTHIPSFTTTTTHIITFTTILTNILHQSPSFI